MLIFVSYVSSFRFAMSRRCVMSSLIFLIMHIVLTFGVFPEDISSSQMLFPLEDVSDYTWAHAVNSREELQDSLAGKVDFLEADVSMGHLIGFEAGPLIAIMAHPPRNVSDLTLERWVDVVLAADSGKGVKLDFKTIEAVKPSLEVLKKHQKKITFPLWLNADILPGPVNSKVPPVPPEDFLQLHKDFFPEATLSIGWTTYFFDIFPPDTWHYGWNHVRAMADVLRCFGPSTVHVTFPVRAVFAARSLPQLQWLLGTYEKSTLTIFSGKKDPVDVRDLLNIRNHFKLSEVFVDVPEPLSSSFHSKKVPYSSVKIPSVDLDWFHVNQSHTEECFAHTYIDKRTIVFGRNDRSAVLLKKIFHVSDDNRFGAEGLIEFFSTDSTSTGTQEVTLILASSKLFLKDDSIDDSLSVDTVWKLTNDSQLHTFKHDFVQQGPSSCRYFKLDIQSDRAFQAWTIPCDLLMDGLPIQDIIQQEGKSEVPKSRRLVLPPGDYIFGILSDGDGGHSVVHQMKFRGASTLAASRSFRLSASSLCVGFMFVALYAILL